MQGHIAKLLTVGIALFSVFQGGDPVTARSITFGHPPAAWHIVINVCTNGFRVVAGGGTTSGVTTTVRAAGANLLLPDNTPPFISQKRQLAFHAAGGSTLVASASDPATSVIGSGEFFFDESLPVNALVETTIEVSANGKPVPLANSTGEDPVSNCRIAAPAPPVSDLGGAARVSATNADRLAVYCLSAGPSAGTIVIDGEDANGGFSRLAEYKYNDLLAARHYALSKPAASDRGEVSLQLNLRGLFVLEWTHGPWGADVVKSFRCTFNKARYNKTPNQMQAGVFGNDGRVAPSLTDKVAVYCRTDKGVIDIFGIDRNSQQGYRLATFSYAALVRASPGPLSVNVPGQGIVALRVDGDDNFYLEWRNGPWSAYEAKAFTCRF